MLSREEVLDQIARGGAAVYELRSNTLRIQQMNDCEGVFVELKVSPGTIQMELSLSTPEGARNDADVDLYSRRQHRPRLFQRHRGRHPMDEHIGRPKGSPPDVGIGSQLLGEPLGSQPTSTVSFALWPFM